MEESSKVTSDGTSISPPSIHISGITKDSSNGQQF